MNVPPSAGMSTRSRAHTLLIALVAGIAMLCGPLAATPAHAADGSISGTVTAVGGGALEGHTVTVYQGSNDGFGGVEFTFYDSADTDSSGHYSISAQAGTYRIQFSGGESYVDEYWDNAPDLASAANVVVGDDAEIVRNAELAPPHISGTVTNSGGDPIEDVSVTAYQVFDDGWDEVSVDTTAANGTYDLAVNAGAVYHLSFQDQASGTYRTEYFDDITSSVDDGADIAVATSNVTGRDAVLERNPTLSGKITNDAAAGIEGVTVTALKLGEDGFDYFDSVSTRVDGRYTLPVAYGGTYRLEFSGSNYVTEYYDNVAEAADATAFSDVTENLTGKDAELARKSAITGTVTGPGGTGDPVRTRVAAYRFVTSDDDPADGYWGEVRGVQTKADGSYALRLDPGTYHLEFQSTPTLSGEVYDNLHGSIAAGDDIVLSSDADSTASAALEAKAKISGKVTSAGETDDADEVPLASASVTAYQLIDGDDVYVANVETDAAGNYALAVDAGGTYKLGFEAAGHQTEYFDDAPDLEDAASFEVTGNVVGKDATLDAFPAIRGTVTGGGRGLAGIEVTAQLLDDEDWADAGSTTTGTGGSYALRLPPGTYRIGFTDASNRYRTEFYNDVTTIDDAASIDLDDDVTANATLAANPTITGTVTRPGGVVGVAVAAVGISVKALKLVTDDDGSHWDQVSAATTASNGTYSLGAPAGTYRLEFADDAGGLYRTEYYNDSSTVEGASDQVLGAGGLTARNAVLAARANIKGTVTGPSGSAAAGVTVRAYQQTFEEGTSYWSSVATVKTSASGDYAIPVRDGTYRLGFSTADGSLVTEYYQNKATVKLGEDVVVAGADVVGKNAQLAVGAGISGTVAVPDGEDFDPSVTAYRLDTTDGSWSRYDEVPADDGRYVISAPAGTYRVKFAVNQDIFDPIYYGPADAFGEAHDIVVGADQIVPNISATFGPTVANAVAPTVTGTPAVGRLLTAVAGSWTPSGVGFTYQWLRGGSPISGATSASYTVVTADAGKRLSVKVTAVRSGYRRLSLTSVGTATVPVPVVTNTVRPRVTGAVSLGKTLRAVDGAWGPTQVALKRQWLRGTTPIAGATSTTYRTVAADLGKKISVRVTGSAPGYTSLTKTSLATVAVKTSARVSVGGKGAKAKARLTITVKATGTKPTGRVRIKLGGRTLRTLTLRSGKVSVTLSGQKKGTQTYTITYLGDTKVTKRTVAKSVKVT